MQDETERTDDCSDELAKLIATLHAAEARLEELTAGEVDAVADASGRTFLLRRAQEQLRHSEAARQIAILDALPAHIALIDAHGYLVSVNAAWRRFGLANALASPDAGVGLNYLTVCDNAQGSGADEARLAAAGFRAVLGGETACFTLEYACSSPSQRRWFSSTFNPISVGPLHGVVVMHVDVTAERMAEEERRNADARFRQMAESIRDVFFLRDLASNKLFYVSPAYEEIWGRSCESLYADPGSWREAIHPDDRVRVAELNRVGVPVCEFAMEFRIVRPDGTTRWVESRGFPVRDSAGRLVRLAGVVTDVTDRNEAKRRVVYLNRVYSMLSGIASLIVRVRERGELFKEACRIAVDEGGFRMAWIGLLDRASTTMEPMASAGTGNEFLELFAGGFDLNQDAPMGKSMIARAIRERRPVVSNDSQFDPAALLGSVHAKDGIRSIAVLPLIVDDEGVGVVALYVDEKDFFHVEELKLLTELAGNISFAIDHIDKRNRLDYLAYYDVLTGLANRTLFLERAAQCIRSATSNGRKLALFIVDIARFKNINDTLGQPAGDMLLRQVSDWIVAQAGDPAMAARIGADHFALLLPEVREGGNLRKLIEVSMDNFLQHPFHLHDTVLRIASKVGAAVFPDDGDDADTLFRNAEAALKKAKASGDRYLLYTPKMTEGAAGLLTLETQLRQALDRDEFVLFYQPKFNSRSGKLSGAEALIRWNDPLTGLVAPGRFIPVLEETGLIYEVGRWALHQAVKDHKRWRAQGLLAVPIAVNVSPSQLRYHGFIDELQTAIGSDRDTPPVIELEVTESVIMEGARQGSANLQAIRALGVRIAIDDFGTGFSSLGYLSRLPVDILKIDRSFVMDMTASQAGLALVSTIITLAHSLKLVVVAEGVETEEQSRLLRLMNCD